MREAIALARVGRTPEVETGFVELPGAEGPAHVSIARAARDRRRGAFAGTCRWRGRPGEDAALVYGIGIDVTERRALEKRAADAEALSAMGTLALTWRTRSATRSTPRCCSSTCSGGTSTSSPSTTRRARRCTARREIVGDEIGRLNRLLTEFLELARPRGAVRELVHFGKLVDDVLDLEQGSAAARGVTVERDLGERLRARSATPRSSSRSCSTW